MTKILFLALGIICSFHSIAQQTAISEGVNVTLPENAQKLNKDQIIAFADENGYERAAVPANPKNVYEWENMLLQFYDSKINHQENDLNRNKVDLDAIFKRADRSAKYFSYIKSFSNCSAQISKFIGTKTITYLFYSINSTDT